MLRAGSALGLAVLMAAQAHAQTTSKSTSYVGAYRDGPADYVVITPLGSDAQHMLLLAETRTEQLRLLFPAGADTFNAGPFLTQPTPVERTLVFGRTRDGVETIEIKSDSPRSRRHQRIAITAQDIRFRNGDITLRGTLLMPSGARNRPAIVMAHGSEDNDRNSFGPLPWVLAAHGYVVVTYDKRGTGRSSGSWQLAGIEPLAQDLGAAVAYIANRRDLAARRIAVLGTSEGGWVAANAARLTPHIDAIVAISGGARTKGDAYMYKMRRLALEAGLRGSRLDSAVAAASLTIQESQRRVALDSATVTGFDRRVTYDPTDDWRQFRGAFLYMGGAADVLESAEKAARWFDRLFKESGHTDYTIKLMPQAHHSLLHAVDGTPSEFTKLTGIRELVPGYWSILLHWLDARLLRQRT